jgi:hypothetical protein
MREAISVFLSIVLTCGLMPGAAEASNSRGSSYEETSKLSNGWDHTIEIHTSEDEDDVWGEGTAIDPGSLDADEMPTRWLSYTFRDGSFEFVGSDDGSPVEVSIAPDDVTCTSDSEENSIVDIAAPDEGPQPLWPVILLVVLVAAAASCDGDGCACGHHGGTPNHPGSNPPEDPGSPNPPGN